MGYLMAFPGLLLCSQANMSIIWCTVLVPIKYNDSTTTACPSQQLREATVLRRTACGRDEVEAVDVGAVQQLTE